MYEGDFVDGKMHGSGSMTYAETGNKFTGQWKGNVKHGDGKFFNAARQTFVPE